MNFNGLKLAFKNFEETKYYKDFNTKRIPVYLCVAMSIFFLSEYFQKAITTIIIESLSLNETEPTLKLDLFCLFILVICFIALRSKIKKRLFPTLNSSIVCLLLFIAYLILFRLSDYFTLTPFIILSPLKYSDVILIGLIVLCLKFKLYSKKIIRTDFESFEEDNFKPSTTDKLDRKILALRIGYKILNQPPLTTAFVIAVNSPWGFGKTVFLHMLKKSLSCKDPNEFDEEWQALTNTEQNGTTRNDNLFERQKDVVTVWFNPWKNFENINLIKDFFEEISASLEEYDSDFTWLFKDYIEALTEIDDTTLFKSLATVNKLFNKPKPLSKTFKNINNAIERTGKKLVVFIDDLDRLTGEEIFEVLKLIRNTANFKNTYFILGYDHNYVLNSLMQKSIITNKEEFLHKVIQMEIILPTYSKGILLNALKTRFESNPIYINKISEINQTLNNLFFSINPYVRKQDPYATQNDYDKRAVELLHRDNEEKTVFFRFFQNIRDVIRFFNSFQIAFENIGNIVSIENLIFLEILKVKYMSVYNLLSEMRFITPNSVDYSVNLEELDEYLHSNCISLNIKPDDINYILAIIQRLFLKYFNNTNRPLSSFKYYRLYFTNKSVNLVNIEEVERALNTGDFNTINNIVEKARRENSYNDFINFINEQKDFTNVTYAGTYFQTILLLANFDVKDKADYLSMVKLFFYMQKELQKKDPEEAITFTHVFTKALQDERFSEINRSELAFYELKNIVDERNNNQISKSFINDKYFLQQIIFNCFKIYKENIEEFTQLAYSMYLRNIENIEAPDGNIVINSKANEIMFELVVKTFDTYLKRFFFQKSSSESPHGRFVFDPYVINYFNNGKKEIESFLEADWLKNKFRKTNEGLIFYDIVRKSLNFPEFGTNKPFNFQNQDDEKLVRKFMQR